MKHADFISPAARLEDATMRLEQAWLETKEHWSDSISQSVEDDFLVPLHGEIRTMLDCVSKLALVMGRAERECQHKRESGPAL